MTKFEQIGVNHQYDSTTPFEANRAFNRSCTICCHKGIHLDCEKCSISHVHTLVMAYFDDIQKGA